VVVIVPRCLWAVCSSFYFAVPKSTSCFWLLQGLLISCKCRWTDATCAIPSRCFDWAGDSPPCSSDQHIESWGSGVCSHNQQPDKVCLYRWQGLCQSLGYQSARLKESCLPARLPGKLLCVPFFVMVYVNDMNNIYIHYRLIN
jgi:hypothetical protein